MAEAIPLLEIEFTPGVWTDVSSYLRSGNTKRGKHRPFEKIQPGVMSVTLKNNGREFDPEYSGNISPGNVIPEKAIRFGATYNAIYYRIFTGTIDRISQRYRGPRVAEATIVAYDGAAELANARLESVTETFMGLPSTPDALLWLRLGEEIGPYAFDRSGQNNHGQWFGTFESVEGTNWLDPDKAIKLDGTDNFLLLPPGAMPTALPWSLHFRFKMDAPPSAGQIAILFYDWGYPEGMTIWIDDSGALYVRFVTNGVVTSYVRTTVGTNWADGQTYLFHIRMAAGQPIDIRQFNAGLSMVEPGSIIGTGGIPANTYHVLGGTGFPYTVDEVMVFSPAASDSTLDALGFAGSGWVNDDAFDRIDRILDSVGWTGGRDITAEWDSFLGATSLNTSVLEHLEALADTLVGRLWVMKDGTLRLMGRSEFLSSPYSVSQVTFGDGPGELGYTEIGDYSYDLAQVENVVYRRNRGPYGNLDMVIGAADATSISQYKLRSKRAIESEYMVPDYEYDLAAFKVDHLKDPKSYLEGIKVNPRDDSTLAFPQVLGREISDRATFIRRPQGVGAAISKEVIIEGISHSFGPKYWETSFYIDETDARRYFLFNSTLWGSNDWRFSA